jgi:hypothetical protein
MNNDIPFDPYKTSFLSPDIRRKLIENNVYQTISGWYRQYPKARSLIYEYNDKFNATMIDNICDVSVVYEHAIDVAENFVEHGVNSNIKNLLPVVLNIVGKNFTGTNYESGDDVRDEMIYLRTTFNTTVGNASPFPVKDSGCVYAPIVTVIRPKIPYNFLEHKLTFRFSMITTAPINKPNLRDGKMDVTSLIKTCCTLESVFQAAIAAHHTILILSPFGHYIDDNPINDIIYIYNYCIMKYGHKFKQIIFAIPSYYPKESIFDIYNSNIIRPQNLVYEIDVEYDKKMLNKSLMSQNMLEDVEKIKKMEELKKLEELEKQ